jgi:hypothetical protein
MHCRGKDQVANEGSEARQHDMVPAVASLVTVPSLEKDHEPANDVWGYSQALGVNRGKAEAFDQLWRESMLCSRDAK